MNKLIIFIFTIVLLFTPSQANAVLGGGTFPPYCSDGIFVINKNLELTTTFLEKIKPFTDWKIKKKLDIGKKECASGGYIRPELSYEYISQTTGIKYEIRYLVTIPVDKNSGKIGFPTLGELTDIVLGARLSKEAIFESEKNITFKNILKGNQLFGVVTASDFPQIRYYKPGFEIVSYEPDKGAIYTYQHIKWSSIPNSKYNTEVRKISVELIFQILRQFYPAIFVLLICMAILGVTVPVIYYIYLIRNRRPKV